MDKFNLKKIAEKSNSWPFVEARNLRDRLEKSGIDNQAPHLLDPRRALHTDTTEASKRGHEAA